MTCSPEETALINANQGLEVYSDRYLHNWLHQNQISLAFTTYQTNRLVLVGRNPQGRLALQERLFDKPMGLYADRDQIYMSTRYQIWRLDNRLAAGETHHGSDRLYVPTQGYTTGDLNVHDVVLDATGVPLFINTDFSCLATLKSGYSFEPVWTPPFISKLAAEDRCHLNGLAMVEGKPTYVTACSATDSPAGWRDHRQQGGIVMHIPSNEIIATGLSMPHSPRWYQDKLWLLNAGTGELGYLEGSKFVPITFCPGFVRGLAFWDHFAFVGMSKLRSKAFGGLTLETRLATEGKTSQCGLLVIDLTNGSIVHWLNFEGVIEELFDIVVLPGVTYPQALGFQGEDIERLITFPGSGGIITSKPTVKRPSLGTITPIAGLPRQVWEGKAPDELELDPVDEEAFLLPTPAIAPPKFQQVYHLNPESLASYDAYTYPSLQKRWQTQPQRGELVGVSASIAGELVGFAIAELLPNLQAELISLFVDPSYRQQGIGTRMMALLERALLKENCPQLEVVYTPTSLTEQGLEPMLQKLGWQTPVLMDDQVRRSRKLLSSKLGVPISPAPTPLPPTVSTTSPIAAAARLQLEQGKQLAKQGDLEAAVTCFTEAIRLQPDYLAAYNRLGNALQTLGKFEEAVAAYQHLIQLNPQLAAAHCNLGSLWQLQGKTEAAIASYQHALQLQPDFMLAHRNLGNLLANQRRLIEAEACLREALRLEPDAPETHQDLGNMLRQVGDIEGAIACFRQAMRLKPDFLEAIHNLGCLMMMTSNMELAQACFQRVLKLDPNYAGAYTNLANTLEAQGNLTQALAAYNRALELNPEATDVLYQREHVRLTLCDWEDFEARMQTLQERIQDYISKDNSPKLSPFFINNFPVPMELHTAVATHWSESFSRSTA
ncbi:MAG: TIGR03032 family protein, partial [Leptolyngbyaceae bacterium]|nr:TIGR03032 family protein [Leptolyngbyaceae bacterium]